MNPLFEDYLFAQGYLVANAVDAAEESAEFAAEALVALAHFAEIHITEHPELASLDMLEVAKRNIGFDVPEAFYRGFPESVRELSPLALVLDQLLHYHRTYGLGDFSAAGHSMFEQSYLRNAFAEDVTPKEFAIITPDEAEKLLTRAAEGFLASTRPLKDTDYQLLRAFIESHPRFPLDRCACKDTGARLIIDENDPELACLIELPDVIRLVEWMLELHYLTDGHDADDDSDSKVSKRHENPPSLRKLNLDNGDRKLITCVLDRLFQRGDIDTMRCLEKKRAWNGLLHHLHYRPRCAEAEAFCQAMRTKDQRSAYSEMERRLADGDVRGAVDVLRAAKGPGAVLRHLDHLLSRIDTGTSACSDNDGGSPATEEAARRIDDDVTYVLSACETDNKILLMQLLLKYGSSPYSPHESAGRIFTFARMGKVITHRETDDERRRRASRISPQLEHRVATWVRERFEQACRGTLGKVFVDEKLRNTAIPLQEGASMGGYHTLPRGTRIPLPEAKKVRAFTYWEKVDDIDLSCFALTDDGEAQEYSWRSVGHNGAWSNKGGIAFSGDQVAGYDGGSEYFDVDLDQFEEAHGDACHYIVFCDNVYSKSTFDRCVCRAGYMLRDIEDSGEVFEPATVQTSFVVNCRSRAAYLFAIDLRDPAIIWLGLGENSWLSIAGEGDLGFLFQYLHAVDIMNLRDFALALATEVVGNPAEADVLFSDEPASKLELREDQELIGSRDTARLLELLNAPVAR